MKRKKKHCIVFLNWRLNGWPTKRKLKEFFKTANGENISAGTHEHFIKFFEIKELIEKKGIRRAETKIENFFRF